MRCNVLAHGSSTIQFRFGHTITLSPQTCLSSLAIVVFFQCSRKRTLVRSLVSWLTCLPNISYRFTEAILFNDRRHTFNANIYRAQFVEKAIGHHDMCPSSWFFPSASHYLHCSTSAPSQFYGCWRLYRCRVYCLFCSGCFHRLFARLAMSLSDFHFTPMEFECGFYVRIHECGLFTGTGRS